MGKARLSELATTIRSKTQGQSDHFDVIFPDRETYRRVVRSQVLTRASVARYFGIPPERISDFVEFDVANAIKFTIYRLARRQSRRLGYSGLQQYGPLLEIEVD